MENINNIKSSLLTDNDGNIIIPKTLAEAVFVSEELDGEIINASLDKILYKMSNSIDRIDKNIEEMGNKIPTLSSSLTSTSTTTAATSAAIKTVNDKIKTPINNLNSTDTTSPLSAYQGKVLDEKIESNSGGVLTYGTVTSGYKSVTTSVKASVIIVSGTFNRDPDYRETVSVILTSNLTSNVGYTSLGGNTYTTSDSGVKIEVSYTSSGFTIDIDGGNNLYQVYTTYVAFK